MLNGPYWGDPMSLHRPGRARPRPARPRPARPRRGRPRPAGRRPARRLATGGAVIAAVVAVASCAGPGATGGGPARTSGVVQFALPPAGHGCTGARRLAGGGARFPVTVSTRQSQVAALANVCINGAGPFPFVIDTGAQGTVLSSSLATKLGLPKVGAPLPIGGAGCSANAQPSRITGWNVAGLALRPEDVISLKIPLFGGRGQPDGLLGSDVWSRFGAMRLDFARGNITVPGPERPAPARTITIPGPSAAPVPAVLLRGRPAAVVPMTVISGPGFTGITVPVRLGTQAPASFTPDTGASQSVVDPATASQASLASAHARGRQGTVCTVVTVPEVRTGPWSVAGHPLTPQVAGVIGLKSTTGVAGLLGADQMSRFGSVIFDYAGGRLVLGAG
jgi:hypothetical protein